MGFHQVGRLSSFVSRDSRHGCSVHLLLVAFPMFCHPLQRFVKCGLRYWLSVCLWYSLVGAHVPTHVYASRWQVLTFVMFFLIRQEGSWMLLPAGGWSISVFSRLRFILGHEYFPFSIRSSNSCGARMVRHHHSPGYVLSRNH